MKKGLAFLCGALLLAGCSSKVPSDGFKALHYGMTLTELRQLGFECKSDDVACSRPYDHPDDELNRFLGKRARVSAITKGNVLAGISITPEFTETEVVEQLTGEFGNPESFDYSAFAGMRKKVYWLSSKNTSIEITTAKDGAGGGQAYVMYNGPALTADLLELNTSNRVNSEDY